MKDAGVDGALSVEEIISSEMRKYQSDKGLRLQTDGSYNCSFEWWRVHHTDYLHERADVSHSGTYATTVRLFSSVENFVDKKRVRL